MAQRKGRSATTVRSACGTGEASKTMAVATAASVPFSSTITLAPWRAAGDHDLRGDVLKRRSGAEPQRAEPLEQVGGRQGLFPLGHGEIDKALLGNDLQSGQVL